jgi:hypothetical protein
MNTLDIESGSFRDRDGRIFYFQGGVYRAIKSKALDQWNILSSTKFFQKALTEGKVVSTQVIEKTAIQGLPLDDWDAVLKHELIPFISYPYEWSFSMLKDGALLQLELLRKALAEDMTMKDASSFNIQWKGAKPVFIDIASFETLTPGTPWVGYKQFCEMFLYPLMLQAYKDVSFHGLLRGRIDGITPGDMNNLMSIRDLFRPGVFPDVYLQAKMQARYADSRRKVKEELRTHGFPKEIIISNLRRLEKIVTHLQWKQTTSEWAEYADDNSYTDADDKLKADFVRQNAKSKQRRLVWDLGCNTGRFSRIASEFSDLVIAMDSDHLAVDRLYLALKKENNSRILPLVMNLADGSPALGWRGEERKSFSERGKPELILALALIHHMVISANIPLREFVNWLASFKCDIVIEFVTKADPMTQILLKNKEDQYDDYDLENFEKYLQDKFTIIQRQPLKSNTRCLYAAHPHTD